MIVYNLSDALKSKLIEIVEQNIKAINNE